MNLTDRIKRQPICKHILFFLPPHIATLKKITRACKPTHPTVQTFVQIRHDTATDGHMHEPITAGLKKLGVQWSSEHSTSHQHLGWPDSFRLRNRQPLVAAKRYASPYWTLSYDNSPNNYLNYARYSPQK